MTSEDLEAVPPHVSLDRDELRIGDTLGPYRLLGPLGVGGMATVFAAEHVGLEKRVALKVLRAPLLGDGDVRRRFLREGILASRVRHPNVVDVTDVGEDRGHAYLVMELLEGESLRERLDRRGAIPVEEALDVLLPILLALAAAHRVDVVHGDVKPENIFIARQGEQRETSKLLDFGISRASAVVEQRAIEDRRILGTPHYMAPEQARGSAIDPRADQYALAVVLFESMAGALPYAADGSNLVELLAEVGLGAARPLTSVWRAAPRALSDVLARALGGAREERYPSITDFGRELLPFAPPETVRRTWDRNELDASGVDREPTGVSKILSTKLRASAPTCGDAPTLAMDATAPAQPATTSAPPSAQRGALRGWLAGTAALAAIAAMVWAAPSSRLPTAEPRDEGGARAVRVVPLAAAPPPFQPAIETVLVRLTVQPSHAVIAVDGRPIAVGAAELTFARGAAEHHVTVEANGFVRWESYVGDASWDRALVLRPLVP
jgi:serine/threonine protein kinase